MFRTFWKLLLVVAVAMSASWSAQGFALLGPFEDWQTDDVGYGNGSRCDYFFPARVFAESAEIGGSKLPGEEYRVNVPFLTYGFDESFRAFFKEEGIAAVEQAIQILNNVPVAGSMTSNLNEWPLNAQRSNFRAKSLGLYDVKSAALGILIQQLGLQNPERLVWSLRHRDEVLPATWNFYVVQRNFDPVTTQISSYINGILYTYTNIDRCASPIFWTVNVPLDTTQPYYATTVAGIVNSGIDTGRETQDQDFFGFPRIIRNSLEPGVFFTSLTRDDAGGLRFLLNTNFPYNFHHERLPQDVQMIQTNFQNITNLETGDLAFLLESIRDTTNTLADLTNLFDGIVVTNTVSYPGNEYITNITSYFTNYPWAPTQVFVTNITTNVVTLFRHDVANISTYFPTYTNYANGLEEVVPAHNAVYPTRPIIVRAYDVVPAEDYQPGMPNVRTNYYGDPSISETNFTSLGTNGLWYPSFTEVGPDGERYPYLTYESVTNGEFYVVDPGLWFLPGTNYVQPPVDGRTDFWYQPGGDVYGYHFHSNMVTEVNITTNVDFFAQSELTIRTNLTDGQIITNIDLLSFLEQARTNSPEDLLDIYTNLLILDSEVIFDTNVITSNAVFFFTNAPFAGAGSTFLTSQVTFRTNIATLWNHTFGNLLTNGPIFTNVLVVTQQSVVAVDPYSSPPNQQTNAFLTTSNLLNLTNASILIIPTNLFGYSLACAQFWVQSITNQLIYTNFGDTNIVQTNVVNVIRNVTNYEYCAYPIEFVSTNDLASNIFGFRREVLRFNTNHIFAVSEITATPAGTNDASVQFRPGIQKVTFVRMTNVLNSDQWFPYTNWYYDRYLINTNGTNIWQSQLVQRPAFRPDIIFMADDLGVSGVAAVPLSFDRTIDFQNNTDINGNNNETGNPVGAGPGIIRPTMRITFGKIAPYFYNFDHPVDFYMQEAPPYYFGWGSFDGTTNDPIVYPTDVNIRNMESQFMQPAF